LCVNLKTLQHILVQNRSLMIVHIVCA